MRFTSSNIVYQMQVIPVKIANFQKSDSTGLKQISPCCKVLTSRKTTCSECDNQLENGTLLKGFPQGKNEHYIVKPTDIFELKHQKLIIDY